MTERVKPTVEERENGPLVFKGLRSMKGTDGRELDVKPVMVLCRCGHSNNKPFCDGSHKTAGFESRGGTPAGRDRVISYEGREVTVHYNPQTCSHAAECGRLASHVFNPVQKPWVQPDNGSLAEIEAVVAACPSGALSLAGSHKFADRAGVEVERNGPYWVTGCAIEGVSRTEGMSEEKFVLCRCGKSGNKPFCDGSHRDAGWRDSD
jgi:CDGSH-type Zn-finger protein